MEGEGIGTDIGIKLLPVMWVFLCIPKHIHCTVHEVQQHDGTSTQWYAYHYPSLFPVLFLQSLYVHFYLSQGMVVPCIAIRIANGFCIYSPHIYIKKFTSSSSSSSSSSSFSCH